jgi:cell pole-organizing protein PopZ
MASSISPRPGVGHAYGDGTMLSLDMILRRATPRDVPATPANPRLADAPVAPRTAEPITAPGTMPATVHGETARFATATPSPSAAAETIAATPATAESFKQSLAECRARWAADVARYADLHGAPHADRASRPAQDRAPAPHASEQARISRLSGETPMPPRERTVFADQTMSPTRVPTGDQAPVVKNAVSWWD